VIRRQPLRRHQPTLKALAPPPALWLPDLGVAKPTRHVSADPTAVETRNQLIAAGGVRRGDQ
jgi:hypothetical protein